MRSTTLTLYFLTLTIGITGCSVEPVYSFRLKPSESLIIEKAEALNLRDTILFSEEIPTFYTWDGDKEYRIIFKVDPELYSTDLFVSAETLGSRPLFVTVTWGAHCAFLDSHLVKGKVGQVNEVGIRVHWDTHCGRETPTEASAFPLEVQCRNERYELGVESFYLEIIQNGYVLETVYP